MDRQARPNHRYLCVEAHRLLEAFSIALFLNEFVPEQLSWVHFDVMAWNLRARPGRPTGGEAMGLLAVFEYLEDEFGEE